MKKIIISEKIRTYRRQHQLTQEGLGQIIGVSAQAISKWERCECYPDITLLPQLAEILACSVNDFFD
ncbi:MAG: helix-turn-helix transcriptional regulator [Clostridia bacterium]|nr:helix-turn-helix transcriptional regulator [Clostridia bacterium]